MGNEDSNSASHPAKRTEVANGDAAMLDTSYPNLQASTVGLEILPLEIRHLIYGVLLPDLLTPEYVQMHNVVNENGSEISLMALIWRRITVSKISNHTKFGGSVTTVAAGELHRQRSSAVAMLQVNQRLRYELATSLLDCLTFCTRDFEVLQKFTSSLTPTTRELVQHIQIAITHTSKSLCKALQQFAGLDDLIVYGCMIAEDSKHYDNKWKYLSRHIIRAIQRAHPELMDAYQVYNDPDYATTEFTLRRPCRAAKVNLMRLDIEEEYDRCHLAEASNSEADNDVAIRLLQVDQEEDASGTGSNSGRLGKLAWFWWKLRWSRRWITI